MASVTFFPFLVVVPCTVAADTEIARLRLASASTDQTEDVSDCELTAVIAVGSCSLTPFG